MSKILGEPDKLLGGTIVSTVPYRFKGIHTCDALVIMPLSFNFNRSAITCVEEMYGIRAFDLFGINSVHKRLAQESATVMGALGVANNKHAIKRVFVIQHVDFRKKGQSTRFSSQEEEDLYHKAGLLESRRMILERYPHVEVTLLYARLINDRTEIEFSEIRTDGSEKIRMVPDFRFRDIFTCPVALLNCMDFRFRRETRGFTRYSLKEDVFDMLQFPGATKHFLTGGSSTWKDLGLACEKHGCRKLIAIHHAECGAYGDIMFNDSIEEEVMHRNQLAEFRVMLGEKHPEVELITGYARLINDNAHIQFVVF